ncbi:MAG: tRNA pseudouridine(38-40) synthase TruA [Oligoflexia bacterium]|nr:tRNA pseudouridine(38-40) synthase TruA [Oligoflexia bacterium]
MIKKYAALLSYAGTNYCGWQSQNRDGAPREEGLPSIQETIRAALARMTGESTTIVGSGRTDAGVHAMGQLAHFVLRKKEWEAEILFKGLNSVLPADIRVLSVNPVPIEFHAQHSALKKQYSYYFQQGSSALPHLAPYSRWIKKKLDLEAMNQALGHLIGEHDFLPFRASGAKPGPSVRTIFEAEAVLEPLSFPGGAEDFGLVRVRLLGSGFLKQMVRGIAGTLLQVGEGRRDPSCIRDILASGDRKTVGPTAPARALWLERVWY